jgi:hypothetical protein
VIVTDKLKSYAAARKELMPGVEHRQHKGLNNHAEISHQPTRQQECQMRGVKSAGHAQRWAWEIAVPELETSVFLIPAMQVKNREERLVILNRVAASVVDGQRGIHPEFVFTYRQKDERQRLAKSTTMRQFNPSTGARSKAHLWTPIAGRQCAVRGSSGFART